MRCVDAVQDHIVAVEVVEDRYEPRRFEYLDDRQERVEQESNDGILPDAQDIDASFISLSAIGGDRGAVLGEITTQYSAFAVVEGFETDDPGNYVKTY